MRYRLHLYVGMVVASGAALFVLSLLDLEAPFFGHRAPAFWLYACGVLVFELKPIKWLRRQGGEFTASWTFSVAMLLSAPLASCLIVVGTASMIGDLLNRNTVYRTAFNTANILFSMCLGAGFLLLVSDGQPLTEPAGGIFPYLPLAMIASAMVYATNSVLTMVALALHQEVAVWPVILQGMKPNMSTDGMLLALAPIFVVVAGRSLLLVPLLLVTAWAVFDSATKVMARQHEALHDALTGLPNRRMFDQQMALALQEAAKRKWKLALIVVDLDGFKEINDRLGHHVGDRVLEVVAGRFQEAVRPQDLVARFGGDEFAVLLHHIDDEEHAVARTRELLHALEAPCMVQDFPLNVRGSFGVALFPVHAQEVEGLLQHADQAMYRAKAKRLGISVFAASSDQHQPGRLSLLGDLRTAIETGALHLNYQPKMRLSDGAIVGVEALVRWQHTARGSIPPGDFMPLAEQTELMPKLTEFVLYSALRQNATWRTAGLDLSIAVNGSARNLADPRFVSLVERALSETGVPAAALEIELTENAVMADPYRTSEVMSALRAMGVKISIDDFGTGFSSLTSLRDLPIDEVKLDRSFVTSMTSTPRDHHIVHSILALAHGLELETVAEGVESAEVLEALERLGCQSAQGYLIARPLAAGPMTAWLHSHQASSVFVGSAGRVAR